MTESKMPQWWYWLLLPCIIGIIILSFYLNRNETGLKAMMSRASRSICRLTQYGYWERVMILIQGFDIMQGASQEMFGLPISRMMWSKRSQSQVFRSQRNMRDNERIERTFDFTKGIHRWYGQYNDFNSSKDPMKEIYEDCNPTIEGRSWILSWDNVCMTREVIKDQCKCKFKQICLGVTELLAKHKADEAMELFLTMKAK